MSRSQQEASTSSLSYEQGGAAASPAAGDAAAHRARPRPRLANRSDRRLCHEKRAIGRGLSFSCPEAGFVIRGKLSEPS